MGYGSLVSLVFHNLPSLYPSSFRRNDFSYLYNFTMLPLFYYSSLYTSFILVDIGDSGQHSDGGVLANSCFGQALEEGFLHFPELCGLPG